MAVSVAVNGKGLTLLDLRMPLPLDFVYDVSLSLVRKTTYNYITLTPPPVYEQLKIKQKEGYFKFYIFYKCF